MKFNFETLKSWWKRYESSTEPAVNFILFRSLYCLTLLLINQRGFAFMSKQIEAGDYPILFGFDYLNFSFYGLSGVQIMNYVELVFLFLAACRIFPRINCGLAAINLYAVSLPLSKATYLSYMAPPIQFLILFAFVSETKGKAIPRWKRDLFVFTTAMVYFQAGAAKVANSGLSWFNGVSFHYHAGHIYLIHPSSLLELVILFRWVSIAASLGILAFELSFPLCMNRRLRPFYVLAGIAFHGTTFASTGIFYYHVWLNYLSFVNFSWLMSGLRNWKTIGPYIYRKFPASLSPSNRPTK